MQKSHSLFVTDPAELARIATRRTVNTLSRRIDRAEELLARIGLSDAVAALQASRPNAEQMDRVLREARTDLQTIELENAAAPVGSPGSHKASDARTALDAIGALWAVLP